MTNAQWTTAREIQPPIQRTVDISEIQQHTNHQQMTQSTPRQVFSRDPIMTRHQTASAYNIASISQGRQTPRATTKATRFKDFLMFAVEGDEPKTYKDDLKRHDSHQWKEAIAKELQAHELNVTWMVVDMPKGKHLLTTKWVFKMKKDANGNEVEHKARLAARGFEQEYGIDYFETYAPVARYETVRLLLALAAHFDLQIAQFDIQTSFLYGILEDKTYILQPEGLQIAEDKALLLKRGLYGLKQAPRVWSDKFREVIEKFGFIATMGEPCLFHHKDKQLILTIYVDDGLIIGQDNESIRETLAYLDKHFKTKRLDCKISLGMKIDQAADGIFISQTTYAKQTLEKFCMSDCKPIDSSLETSHNLTQVELQPVFDCLYREPIGAVLYLASNTLPDILFTVDLLSRFTNNPQSKHLTAVKRVMRYIS